MSAIRPPVTSILFPPHPGGQTPVRASRSDFFKAALDAVQTGGVEPATPPATPAPSAAIQEDRPARPGALLDIRV